MPNLFIFWDLVPLDVHFAHPPPPSYRPPISSVCCRITSQLQSLPTSFPGKDQRPPGRRPPPTSTSLHHLLYAPCHVPEFATMSHIRLSSICPPQPTPGSLLAPGGSPVASPSAYLSPASLPVCCAESLHLLGLSSSGCPFRARAKGQVASTTYHSITPAPASLQHGHVGAVTPPPVVLIPSPSAKLVEPHARMYSSPQIQWSSKGMLGSLDQGTMFVNNFF